MELFLRCAATLTHRRKSSIVFRNFQNSSFFYKPSKTVSGGGGSRGRPSQTLIPVNLEPSQTFQMDLSAAIYFRKTFRLKYLNGFWMYLCESLWKWKIELIKYFRFEYYGSANEKLGSSWRITTPYKIIAFKVQKYF